MWTWKGKANGDGTSGENMAATTASLDHALNRNGLYIEGNAKVYSTWPTSAIWSIFWVTSVTGMNRRRQGMKISDRRSN